MNTHSGIGDWSVSSGSGFFDNGTANDGVAIYTYDDGDWQMLDQIELLGPDLLGQESASQIQVEPTRIWFTTATTSSTFSYGSLPSAKVTVTTFSNI